MTEFLLEVNRIFFLCESKFNITATAVHIFLLLLYLNTLNLIFAQK